MRVIIVTAEFPPMRSSGAVQMRDLVREFVRQGHQVTCLAPTFLVAEEGADSQLGGDVHRPWVPQQKSQSRVLRACAEALTPLCLMAYIARHIRAFRHAEGVVWYSPTIFLGPAVAMLRRLNRCPGYLIIRDIFPEWAADMGLMNKGAAYRIFKAVARIQYATATTIGVQTPGNLIYFSEWKCHSRQLEVLQNWLADPLPGTCSLNLGDTILSGRKIFVYAGNMGVAQDMSILLDLAQQFTQRSDVGFLFVGKGSMLESLKQKAATARLENVLFAEEIAPEEIAGLYRQCHVGLVALDPRHKTHNIPGKFLPYLAAGLPVLARVNAGNDLVGVIDRAQVGIACTNPSLEPLVGAATSLLQRIENDTEFSSRCRALFKAMFSADTAVQQITDALRRTQTP